MLISHGVIDIPARVIRLDQNQFSKSKSSFQPSKLQFSVPAGAVDAPATRTPCVGNNEQHTTRLTDSSKSKQNNQTKIMYLNARSLKSVTTNVNKVRDFSALIELSESDIYGITETWLNSSILDSEQFPEHYIVYRKGRDHTFQHNILDIVFTNITEILSPILEFPCIFPTDHAVLNFSLFMSKPHNKIKERLLYNYKCAQWGV